MPEKRFFLDAELLPNSQNAFTGEEGQHLKVMRCHEGDIIEVINGKGILAQAKILQLDKKAIKVEIIRHLVEAKPLTEIILAQGLPRLNRLDTILEKCTELGVTKILLFPAEYSEKKDLSPTQLVRANHIIIAAMKQSGRLYLPDLEMMPPLKKWLPPKGDLYFGDVAKEAPLFKNVWTEPKESVLFFIGPEQGLSEIEENILKDWKAKGVRLHNNILRTDTAPISALSLISHFML